MGTRTCTPDVNGTNADLASSLGYAKDFAPVKVAIDSVDGSGVVHFTAKGSLADNTTTWKLPDVWAPCPTTVDKAAGGAPDVGSEGILYVGRPVWSKLDGGAQQYSPRLKWPQELVQRWNDQRKSTPDGFRSEPAEPADLAFDTLGFPHQQPFSSFPLSGSYRDLPISVDRVRLVARLPGASTTFEFQLFEPGAPGQVLDLDSVYVTLAVRNPATGKFEDTRMQLLEAHVHGTDRRTTIPAELDLLDPTLSNAFQVIDFKAGHDVVLKLSQKGFALFGEGWPTGAAQGVRAAPDRSKVVTFLARPAPGVDPIPPDGDNAIEKIRNAIEPFVAVREISSLLEIVQHLRRLEFQPELIQIIGHGSPGLLSLGYFWDPSKYADGDWGPFYLLDSNPYAYGVLLNDVKPPTRVVLAGCDIVAARQSPMIADGRALVTDLHTMWGCDVMAADNLVGPENFEYGLFVGSMQGFEGDVWKTRPGKSVSIEVVDPADSLKPAGSMAPSGGENQVDQPHDARSRFTDVVITSAPALGRINHVFLEQTGKLPESALDHYSEEIKLDPILALHEISFRGRLDGEDVELHLMCNATLLKAIATTDRSKIRYFRSRSVPVRRPESVKGFTDPLRHPPVDVVPLRSHVFDQLLDNQLRHAASAPSPARAPGTAAGVDGVPTATPPGKPTASPVQPARSMTNGQNAELSSSLPST